MLNIIPRQILPLLINGLSEPFISVIIGPRQTGKTTLINQLINHLKSQGLGGRDILSFNFDHSEMRASIKSNPESFLHIIEQSFGQTLPSITSKKFIFIDEVQKLPDIFDILKIIHDQYKQTIKLIISGSSSLNLYQHSAETLVGRVRFFHIGSLSWRELTEHFFSLNQSLSFFSLLSEKYFNENNYLSLQQNLYRQKNNIGAVWNNYLLYGGLPEILIMEKHEQKSLALRDYTETYLEKDIRALKTVGDADLFLSALNFFLQNDSRLINLAALSQTSGVQRITLKKYLRVLEETFIISSLSPLVKGSKQSVKSSKIYFFDHGIINYGKKIYSIEQLKSSEQFGAAFENIIINNCLKHFANDPEPPAINFWRDYQEHEIDLVISRGDKIIPVEITASVIVSRQKINSFKHFFFARPECEHGLIVYGGEFQKIAALDKPIFAIPYWMWF